MITEEQIKNWRLKANHHLWIEDPKKIKSLCKEILVEIERHINDTKEVQTPRNVSKHSKRGK